MRGVLTLALSLLGLTLALNYAGARAPLPRAGGAGADGGLDLILASKPPLRPPGRLGASELFDVALVGDRVLVPEEGERGLQLLTLGPGLRFQSRLTLGSGDAEVLARRVAKARPGAVLMLTAVDPERSGAEAWEETLRILGARSSPFGERPAGWVFLAARLREGWVPLAEAYSEETGVALAFTLAPDLVTYRGHRATLHLPSARTGAVLHLDHELPHGVEAGRIDAAPIAFAGGQPHGALLFAPQANEPASLTFPPLDLGEGAAFTTFLAFPDAGLPSSDGVTCELHLDGRPVARRYLPPATRGWVAWRVLLKDAAGTSPRLGLVTNSGPDATGDSVLWGEPRLVTGQR